MGFFGYVGVAVDGYVYGSHRKVFAVVGYGEFEAFVGKERKTVYIGSVVAVLIVVAQYGPHRGDGAQVLVVHL